MKSFRSYIAEDVIPTALVKDGSIDVNREDVRENLNLLLSRAVEKHCVTPYIALNKVRKILENFHIHLPRRIFLEGSRGLEVFEIHQYGHKMGMTDQGEFVKEVPANYFLFLKYEAIGSMFMVVAKVLDKADLDKYLDFAEGSLKEDAQMRQSLAKAVAPKEKAHTALGDCDCSQGDSPSTKAAVDVSMREKDKKLSASSLEEDADIDTEGHKRRIKKLRSDVLEEMKMTRKQKDMAVRRFMSHDSKAGESILAMGKKDREEKKSFKSAEKEANKWQKHRLGEEQVEEGRMPPSVIKHKQKLANMTPEELKKKFAGKSEQELKSMAWRHGYGKDSDVYSKHGSEKKLDEEGDVKHFVPKPPKNKVKVVGGNKEEMEKQRKKLDIYHKARNKARRDREEQIDEKLTKKMSAGDVISDFVHSNDPKFKGKSKKERQKMALGAYYGMHPEKSKK